jgi:hypothetical protein
VSIVRDRNIEIAWAAGVLEGEGTFIKRNINSLSVSCEMTDLDVLEKLVSIFGGKIYVAKAERPGHWKKSWRWVAVGPTAERTMTTILPFMMARRSLKIRELLSRWRQRVRYIEAHKSKVREATEYYKSMPIPSLRKAGKVYGISYECVRRGLISSSNGM